MTIVDRLRQHAQTHPERSAFRFLADGEQESDSLTFAELDAQARRFAAHLADRDVHQQRVLLVLPQDLSFIAAFFGCLYAGAVAVPMLVPHPRRPLSTFLSIARNARPCAILTTREIEGQLKPRLEEFGNIEWLFVEDLVDVSTDKHTHQAPHGADLAFLQYTSGSTGSPKGVMVSHHNLMHNEAAICRAFGFSQASVVGGWLPMYHDMGLIGLVLAPVYYGVPCVLMPPLAFLQQPARWLKLISSFDVTFSGGPNFAYDVCVDRISEYDRKEIDLSGWRVAFNGAEPVRFPTIERFCASFAACGFSPRSMYPCYGMAEATLFVTGGACQDEVVIREVSSDALQRGRVQTVSANEKTTRVVGCGRPWGGTRVEVINPATRLRSVKDEVGEIWIAGESVVRGYFGSPEESAEVFGARLADTEDGIFLRTGDLGFVAEGNLYVTGRLKDLIIIRGKNHYPQDIDATMAASSEHAQTGAGAAFTIEFEREDGLVLIQELRRTSLQVNFSRIILDIQESVASEHGLRAREIALVKPGTIPKTSSGKLRRSACRDMYLLDRMEVVYRYTAAKGTSKSEAIVA